MPFCRLFAPWILSFLTNLNKIKRIQEQARISQTACSVLNYLQTPCLEKYELSNQSLLDKTGRFQDNQLQVTTKVIRIVPPQVHTGWIFILDKVAGTFCLHLDSLKRWRDRLSFDLAWQPGWPVDDFQKCHCHRLKTHTAAKETLMKIIHSPQKKK